VQAITRGHTIVVTFGTNDFTITDIDVADDDDARHVATDALPPHITVYKGSSIQAGFTPLGTLSQKWSDSLPVKVTLWNGESTREVEVGLIGEVQIQ
jgi:hypothetical protein